MKERKYNFKKIAIVFTTTIAIFGVIGITTNNSYNTSNIDNTTTDLLSKSNSNEATVKASNTKYDTTFNNYLNEVMSKAAGKEESNNNTDSNTSLEVEADKVAPIINEPTITGTISDAGWYNSDVLIQLNGAVDTSDVTLTIDKPLINYNTAGETVTITATDAAGNVATKQIIIKVDKVAPEIVAPTLTGTMGENGWYTSTNVTVAHNNATDDLSGVKETTIDKTLVSGDTAGEKVIITSVDNAGNVSTYETTIKIDTVAPTINEPTISGTMGSDGWYITDVKISHNDAKDEMSGVKETTIDTTEIGVDTPSQDIVITSVDNAGNKSTYSTTVKVDKTRAHLMEPITYYSKIDKEFYSYDTIVKNMEEEIKNKVVTGPSKFVSMKCDKDTFIRELNSSLKATLICDVETGNGLLGQVKADYISEDKMINSGVEFNTYLDSMIDKDSITEISYEHGIDSVYYSKPTSEQLHFGDGVVGYVDGNILRIQSEEYIYANFDSSNLFSDFTNVEILNLENFHTFYVNDYSEMFRNMSNLTNIHFENLRVKNDGYMITENMFLNTPLLTDITINRELASEISKLPIPAGITITEV